MQLTGWSDFNLGGSSILPRTPGRWNVVMSLFSDKHMNKESPISPGTLRKQCTVRDINLGELLQTDKLKSQKSPGSCRGCTQGTSIEFNVPREPLQLCEQDGTKSIQSHAHSLKCVPKRKIQVL